MGGCVPAYWKHLTQLKKVKECKTAEELKNMHHLIGHYKSILLNYNPPCIDMKSLISYTKGTIQTDRKIVFKIVYTVDVFQEITNVKEFTFEMFWSSVGGFLGIFLGYSVLQVPELIMYIMPFLKRLRLFKSK